MADERAYLRPVSLNSASRILAGLDVGVRGSVLVLVLFALHSVLAHEYWWAKLNVLGSFFYGLSAFNSGMGRVTLAGGAIVVVLYGLAGTLFSLLTPGRAHSSLIRAAMAIGFGLLWHLAMVQVLLPWVSPFSAGYFPHRLVLLGNLLFILVLLRLNSRFRKLASPPPANVPKTEESPFWQHDQPSQSMPVTDKQVQNSEEILSSGSQPPTSGSSQ